MVCAAVARAAVAADVSASVFIVVTELSLVVSDTMISTVSAACEQPVAKSSREAVITVIIVFLLFFFIVLSFPLGVFSVLGLQVLFLGGLDFL